MSPPQKKRNHNLPETIEHSPLTSSISFPGVSQVLKHFNNFEDSGSIESMTTSPPPSRRRSPLVPKGNDVNIQPTSQPTPKSLPSLPNKRIRRKQSAARIKVDSSESDPSSHSSIFEALYFSPNSSEASSSKQEQWPMVSLKRGSMDRSSIRPVLSDENASGEMSAMEFATRTIDELLGSTPILYGKGTALETIIEQRSHSTISVKRTKSFDDALNHSSSHQQSIGLPHSLKSKHSFSADDLTLIRSSYHEAMAGIESIHHIPRTPKDIYAGPMRPIHPPPDRPPTPPGMPSWNEAQAAARYRSGYRGRHGRSVSAPQRGSRRSRLSRFILGEENDISFHSRVQAPGTESFVANMQRFRPPRNSHGDLHAHPFNRASVAQIKTAAEQPTVPQAGGSYPAGGSGQPPPVPPHRTLPGPPTVRLPTSVDIPRLRPNTPATIQRPCFPRRCMHRKTNPPPTPPRAVQEGYSTISSPSPNEMSYPASDVLTLVNNVGQTEAGDKLCWKCKLEHFWQLVKYCSKKTVAFFFYMCLGVEWQEAEEMVTREFTSRHF